MSAATDRLSALTAADFAGGGHRAAFPQTCADVATVAPQIAADAVQVASRALATTNDRAQTGLDRAATTSDRRATSALAGIAANRIVGRDLNDPSHWPILRATPFWSFGPDGALVQTAADTLAWDFDPATNVAMGAAFAGARTNAMRNPRAEGFTAGVIGSGGVMPTFWSSQSAGGTGISREVVGGGVETSGPYAGANYLDVRVFGTSSGFSTIYFRMEAFTFIAAPTGTRYAVSLAARLIAGSLVGLASMDFGVSEFNSGGTYLREEVSTFPLSASLQRLSRVSTASHASAAFVANQFRMNVANGNTIDLTARVYTPQIEIGAAFASLPVLPSAGSPAASTRAEGAISVPVQSLGVCFNRRQGVIVVEWNSLAGPFTSAADTDAFGLISLGDTTANEVMGVVLNPAHNLIEFRRVVGGAAQTVASVSITPPTAGQSTRCAFAWDADAGLMQVAARGAAGTQLTGQTSMPAITHVMLGRFSTSRPHFGGLRLAEIRPAASFGAALAAMT